MAAKGTEWRPGPSVCRCCFAEGCYKDISTEYFWMGKREVYSEMLTTTFDISIAYSQSGGPNSNSRLICEPCISRLRDAADFKRQVQECERVFLQHLDPVPSRELEVTVQITPESPEKEVKLERVKVERKLSDDDFEPTSFPDDDDDDDDDMDDEPLTKLASKVPKKESVDLMDLLDNAKAEKRKSTTKVKATPAKKVKKKEAPKPSASNAPPKTEKKKKGVLVLEKSAVKPKLKKKADEIADSDDDCDTGTARKVSWKRKTSFKDPQAIAAALILENSNAVPFKWKKGKYLCVYCDLTTTDMMKLRIHSTVHDKLSIFNSRARAIFPLRVDITDFTCNLCRESIENVKLFKHHLESVHSKEVSNKEGVMPFVLTKNEFKCVICAAVFSSFMNLVLHMNEHYPNHVCHACGKSFSSIDKLRRHRTSHDTRKSSCLKCGKIFPSVNERNKHVTSVHGPKNRYSCPHCDARLGSYHARLRHMQREHGIESEYPCGLCDAVFATGTIRSSHVRIVHKKVRQVKKRNK